MVFLVGTIIGLAALRVALDDGPSDVLTGADEIVAGGSLAVMIALNVWNKGRLKLFCILIGIAVGYLASAAVGLLTLHDLNTAFNLPVFAPPSFSQSRGHSTLVDVPFAVSALASAMSSTAVITTYHRLTDAEWARPDMTSIGRGVLGDGIATTIAGLLGTYGVTVSSANVGLVAATGVASRMVAFAMVAILVVAALEPGIIGLLTIMPHPVMSAAMLFTAVFIMISGVQIISTRVLDARRTLVIGMALLSFIVVSVYPSIFTQAPVWAHPLVTSPLVLATLVALCLNLLFRIGIRRKVVVTIDPSTSDVQQMTNAIESSAGMWGARRDVINRIEFTVMQTVEAVIGFCDFAGPIILEISFDEFVIDVVVRVCRWTCQRMRQVLKRS